MARHADAGEEAGKREPEIVFAGTQGGNENGAGSDSSIPVIEPGSISFQPDTSQRRSGKRRPTGSRATIVGKPAQKATTQYDLTGLLLSLHMMGAAFTNIRELKLEEQEARQLSEAIKKVNDFYGGMMLPEKYAIWMEFTVVLGTVYGTRAMAYSNRLRNEAEAAKGGKPIEAQAVRIN